MTAAFSRLPASQPFSRAPPVIVAFPWKSFIYPPEISTALVWGTYYNVHATLPGRPLGARGDPSAVPAVPGEPGGSPAPRGAGARAGVIGDSLPRASSAEGVILPWNLSSAPKNMGFFLIENVFLIDFRSSPQASMPHKETSQTKTNTPAE